MLFRFTETDNMSNIYNNDFSIDTMSNAFGRTSDETMVIIFLLSFVFIEKIIGGINSTVFRCAFSSFSPITGTTFEWNECHAGFVGSPMSAAGPK